MTYTHDGAQRTRFLVECGIIIAALVALGTAVHIANLEAKTIIEKSVSNRATKNDRKEIMLSTCFPEGIYKADAAPGCPAFKDERIVELNKNEITFAERKLP